MEHGKWIDCSNGWMCSSCGKDSIKEYTYCPHCGAKMDLKEKTEAIPIEWVKNKVDEIEDRLFELTKDKSRPRSLDEIRAFTDLDQYAYTLKKIYYDYTGEYYDGNHYMLREKENGTN